LLKHVVVGRLLDDERRVTFESVEQLVRKQPLIDLAEMMVGISANGRNDQSTMAASRRSSETNRSASVLSGSPTIRCAPIHPL
jgi:hypothetical protein